MITCVQTVHSFSRSIRNTSRGLRKVVSLHTHPNPTMNQAGPSTGIASGNPSRNASTILPVAMRQGPETDQQKLDHVQAHLDAWWNSFTDRRLRWVYTKKANGQIMGSAWQQGNLDTIGLKRQGSSSLIQSPTKRAKSGTFDDTVKMNPA